MQARVSQASLAPAQPAPDPLARLLLRWGLPGAPAQPLAERLGGFLDWTDAVLLAQTLGATPPADATDPLALQTARDWAAAALLRLRAELGAGFVDPLLERESATPAETALTLNDLLAPYRLHHAQQQRLVAARVAGLRERLRVRLLQSGASRLIRLAQLDAVFDRALAERERQALAGLAGLLFGARASAHQVADPRHWPARLWADLQQALHAELELRLQPSLGLIEALQAEPEPAGSAG